MYKDPSGYYTFVNGTPKEQSTFAEWAANLDKKVEQKTKHVSPAEGKVLQQLHRDLQPDSGGWKVGFGKVSGSGI